MKEELILEFYSEAQTEVKFFINLGAVADIYMAKHNAMQYIERRTNKLYLKA